MKTLRLISAMSATVLLTLTAAGQDSSSTTTVTTTTYVPTTTVIGSRIVDVQGQDIGQVADVVLDKQTGCMAYVVLATTDTSGVRKTVAAPWAVFSPGSDNRTYTVRIEKEKIYSAPVWESTRINEYNRTDWINNVYTYYGVQPQVGVNVQSNFGNATEQRRDREQQRMQQGRGNQTAPGQNADTLTRPNRNPNRPPGANQPAPPTSSSTPIPRENAPASSPGADRDRNRRPQESPSASPSSGAAAEEESADRAARRASRRTQEASPSPGREATQEESTDRAARRESRKPEGADASGTPETNRPHRGGKHAPGAESKPEASPTP